jgi:hypothetical protein
MKILTLIGIGLVAHYCYKTMKSKNIKNSDVNLPESEKKPQV